ncbi:pyridoxal-phosphate dependent enzyme [Dactylosporangium aurantiacum]|uniref:Pyridoxal-phosphate dependent enzyme n=1 Tax=Dactylosporangium aurantiacum TaxID=35754 RepID=A0A9Q9IQF9_9ACTN|nr:pyridoxal-phosphate dependent enzyme [Dactylosporangium aurantiacum]MDG6109887.1 pyridoxal-phosphate dependent enzyme [Dactylosporangium aurantiacum]UWZ58115.1 pyridoxal-phosphate dependent enzyme [Dactylosporangium aurantiacum]
MQEPDRSSQEGERRWAQQALARLRAAAAEEPAIPLRRYPLPGSWGVRLYFRDESRRPTGSVKHRLVRRLVEDAVVRGDIRQDTTVVEATAGNTAVATAYFAKLIGVPFIAVVPGRTARAKRERVERYGGTCHAFDPPAAIYDEAARLAAEVGGYYLDHLAAARHAEDWRAPDSVGAALLAQVIAAEGGPPTWVVVGVGTGATSATLGCHLRHHGYPTRLAAVDPEHSAYWPSWVTGYSGYGTGMPSRIEGIGRPRVEPAFLPSVIDLAMPVPDAASVAAMRHLATATGWSAGPSTGANLWAALRLAARMRAAGETGSIATLICDGADAYRDTYCDDDWLRQRQLDPGPYTPTIERFLAGGPWSEPT